MALSRSFLNCTVALFTVMAFLPAAPVAKAGEILERIRVRGDLRCGVSEGILGFSAKDSAGNWSGMDVDFCRALSAVVLGSPDKVVFVPLTAAERFASLKAGRIDLLARNTTWTLEREAVLDVHFAGILYHGAQRFMVPASSDIRELSQLNGSTICVVKGSSHERNLADMFLERNWSYQPLPVESQAKAAEALFSGQCQAFTSEEPQLAAMKLLAPKGLEEYHILDEAISKEPVGPVVRAEDEEWFTLVRWVYFAMILAEESGVTRANVRSKLGEEGRIRASRWKELDGIIAKSMKIEPGWGIRLVEACGNYGEIFERNLGSGSVLKLDRGLNRLWNQGGLMYSPPFR